MLVGTREVPPPDGWLFAGDPGEFPPRDVELCCPGGCCLPVLPGTRSAPERWATPGVPQPAAASLPTGSGLPAGLDAALDAIAAFGPLSGSRADTTALLRCAERARGLALRELAEMDATGGHQQPGRAPTTAAAWLRDSQHLTDNAARRAVRLGRELREDLPEVNELLLTGQITLEHAAAVADGVRGLDRELIREAGGGLTALALVTDPTDLRKRLQDKAAALDDRLTADADRKARDRQHLKLAQVGGHTAVTGTLAGEDGATVRLAMSLAVEAQRTDGDTRSPSSRQADIFVQWATDYLQRHTAGDSLAGDAHTVRSHLLMTCTPDQLPPANPQDDDTSRVDDDGDAGGAPDLTDLIERDLAGGGQVSPSIIGSHVPLSRAALRRLACDATLTLAVLRTPGQDTCPGGCTGPARPWQVCEHLAQPLYVGRSARTISGLQFKALVIRDRTCVVRGCHRPPAQCAAHHVQHWADGGAPDLDNLVLLCHQHHHDLHDRRQNLPHHD